MQQELEELILRRDMLYKQRDYIDKDIKTLKEKIYLEKKSRVDPLLLQKEEDLLTRVNELKTMIQTQKETIHTLEIEMNKTKRTCDFTAEELRETSYKQRCVSSQIDEIISNMSL